jgi:hypothetical protein
VREKYEPEETLLKINTPNNLVVPRQMSGKDVGEGSTRELLCNYLATETYIPIAKS